MNFFSVERLPAPFFSVSEVGLAIPPLGQGEATVLNDECKLLFFLEADCVMAIDGLGEWMVREGDILVMPQAGVQRYRVMQKRHKVRVHALKIVLAPIAARGKTGGQSAARRSDPEADPAAFVRHHFATGCHLSQAQDAAMSEALRAVRREAEQRLPGAHLRVSALCTELAVMVARRIHEPPAKPSTTGPGYGTLVNQTKEFLRRNFSRDLALAEISWHVRKSDEHLARVFRKVTGQTVFDYLRVVRVETAKTLLIHSEKSLTEIATNTGFSSLAVFSRTFSQYVGHSPSEYRRKRAQEASWGPLGADSGTSF